MNLTQFFSDITGMRTNGTMIYQTTSYVRTSKALVFFDAIAYCQNLGGALAIPMVSIKIVINISFLMFLKFKLEHRSKWEK